MDDTFQNLWCFALEFGRIVRTNLYEDKMARGGLECWKSLSENYVRTYIEGFECGIPVNESFRTLYQKIYSFDSSDPDHLRSVLKIGNDSLCNGTKEEYHFIIQHCRIPCKESNKLSVLKLLQIAYNAGQYMACLEHDKNVYPVQVILFYDKHKLSDIRTYIDPNLCDRIVKNKY